MSDYLTGSCHGVSKLALRLKGVPLALTSALAGTGGNGKENHGFRGKRF